MKKKDTTENEFFAHIKQSLESYEEAYIPGSWENFLQKKRVRQRKLFLRIASGIAACLLVGYVGSNFIHFETRDNLKSTAEQTSSIIRNSPDVEINSKKKSQPSIEPLQSDLKQSKSAGTESKANSILKENLIAEGENKASEHAVVSSPAIDTTTKISAFAKTADLQLNNNKADTIKSSSDTIIGKTTNTFLNTLPTKENQNIAATTKRKVRLGINFSPSVNTSRSAGPINYMGGLSADIPLFSKFQLSTGLQVENQSILKEYPGTVSSSSFASSTAPMNQTRTKMINLDVPVNITWIIVSEKSHSYYVSAGLSSLVYLRQENKNTTYSDMLVPVSSVVAGEVIKTYNLVNQASVTQNTVTPIQTFDFGGRINIMVGFERKLTDRLFIHFEPYTKIPTTGQTPGSLNHTTSGINFKISF